MRSDFSEDIILEEKEPSRKNEPYIIGKTVFNTEWTPIAIKFNHNLIVLEPTQENYKI
jgi:hypothetical protein